MVAGGTTEVRSVENGMAPAARQVTIGELADRLRRRFGVVTSSATTKEKDMGTKGQTTIEAPSNPYRRYAADGGMLAGTMGFPEPTPRRADTARGPGLTAADLDVMVRQHFRDGFAAAEREGEKVAESLRGQLGDAFDEGYTAGRVEQAQGLAKEAFSRLFGPQMKLVQARGRVNEGTKAGDAARVGFDEVEASLHAVQQWLSGLFGPHDAGTPARAAAQVARDES